MKELFKYVVGYEKLYKVSNLGYIKNCISKKIMVGTGHPVKQNWYLRVNLSKDKEIKTRYVHRIVAESFVQNPENKPCVNHKNAIKTDNRSENLEWCTHKENTIHAWSIGLMENIRNNSTKTIALKGEENPRSKLTNKQVLSIRREYGPGNSIYKLSKQYGVSKSKIYQIVRRQSWKHI